MSEEMIGTCHCGAVKFKVTLKNGLDKLMRCNCTLCRRKGTIMASVVLEALVLIQGEENLTLYQWNTHTAKHYFCNICGIYTHHQRRSVPTEYGINIACLDDVDPSIYRDVPIADGASL